MHVHHTCGSMEIPKNYYLHWFFLSFKVYYALFSSEPLLSSFVAFHVANHIYICDTLHGACILSITVHMHNVHTYPWSLHFIIHPVHATLIHTMAPHFVIHHLCTIHAYVTFMHTIAYYQWGSPQLNK